MVAEPGSSWSGFSRTSFSQGKVKLTLLWPLFLALNKSYRENFNRALKRMKKGPTRRRPTQLARTGTGRCPIATIMSFSGQPFEPAPPR